MAESSRDRLLKQFRELVGERLGKITRSLMELEGGPSPEEGKSALRELHGLKGEARMMGFADVNRLVHEMEELVRIAEPQGYALTGGSTDALLVAADAVLDLVGAAESGTPPEVEKLVDWLKARTGAELELRGGPKPRRARRRPPRPRARRERRAGRAARRRRSTAAARRAPSDKQLDGSLRISQQSLEVLTTAATNLTQSSPGAGRSSPRAGYSLARELAQIARAAEDLGAGGAELAARLTRAKETAAQLHREEKLLANEELKDLSQLAEEVQTLRMLPLSVLFEPYPRMVRDLAKELGKEVELVVEGEETRADRSVRRGAARSAPAPGAQRARPRPRVARGAGARGQAGEGAAAAVRRPRGRADRAPRRGRRRRASTRRAAPGRGAQGAAGRGRRAALSDAGGARSDLPLRASPRRRRRRTSPAAASGSTWCGCGCRRSAAT